MRFLLDTHVWLWLQFSPGRVSTAAMELLRDPESELLLSAASSWEIAVKYALGKLPLPEPPESYVPGRIHAGGVTAVAVEHSHALHVAALPKHHRDPFDRLLIAQATVDGLPIVTADRKFEPYDVEKVWAT